MAELVFPIAAVALTFLLVMPAMTLLSRAVLAWRRRSVSVWSDFGSAGTFAWLVAPVLVPLTWLMSGAVHQLEAASGADTCATDHAVNAACFDVSLLVISIGIGSAAAVAWRLWCERPRLRFEQAQDHGVLSQRVSALIAGDPALSGLNVEVVGGVPSPVFTIGIARPRVVVDACFVSSADDAVLRAALLHERAHIDGRDLLRGFLARLVLAMNPAGGWLAHDYARWRRAREAQCDGEAVARGGEPLALAHGILHAARFRCVGHLPEAATALCGHDAVALRLRLALLFDGPPQPRRSIGHRLLVVALVAAAMMPHLAGFGALEILHFEVEQLFHSLP